MSELDLKTINEIVQRLYDYWHDNRIVINEPQTEQAYYEIQYYLMVELPYALEQLNLKINNSKKVEIGNLQDDEIPF